MGKLKKIKKWARQGAESATRAEKAARQAQRDRQRVQTLLASQRGSEPSLGQVGSGRAPIYTAPAGSNATAPIGEVKGRAR